MPTRSGKPYQDPKKKKENQDVSFNATRTPGKDIASNIIASTMSCIKDVRVRKSARKRVISTSNIDTENATDKNWIVSDISCNKKETQDVFSNCSMNSNIDNDFEPKSETVTALKMLRRKKSSLSGDVKTKTKKNKVKDITTNNDLEMGNEQTNTSNNSEIYKDKGYQKDSEENDINTANVINKQINNKKKVKNGKKKKQKKKLSPFKTYNLNDMNDIQTDNGDTGVNISLPTNKSTEKRDSNVKDVTFDKEERSIAKDNKTNSNNNSFKSVNDEELNINSPKNKRNPKKKSSIKNSTFVLNNIFDTTYEKHDTTKESINSRNKSALDLNDSNDATNCFRMKTPDKGNSILNNETGYIINREISSKINTSCKSVVANIPNGSPMPLKKRKSDAKNSTFEIINEDKNTSKDKTFNNSNRLSRIVSEDLDSSNMSSKQLHRKKSIIIDTTFEKDDINSTYIKDGNTVAMSSAKDRMSESKINVSDSKRRLTEVSDRGKTQSFDAFKKGAAARESSIKDDTFDKIDTSLGSPTRENIAKERILSSSASKRKSMRRHNMDINNSVSVKLDSTFDVTPNTEIETKQSTRNSTEPFQEIVNTTFDKDVESSSKSSLISSDNSDVYKNDIPQISITSDESEENIADTTPIYVASSMDESKYMEDLKESLLKVQTPMKREGTFTKDGPEIERKSPKTPERSVLLEMSQAGCTPYHGAKSSQKKPMLNITRSVEKKTSLETAPRLTRVMFCSPIDNPTFVAQEKNKIIKSSLKGSSKSFAFDEDTSISRPGRKRSYTHSDADSTLAKRSRFDTQQKSVDRQTRPRTASATGKLTSVTPKKTTPKSLSKTRARLPNFAALHQKQFDKMESLTDYKERKAMRARQMLTPSGAKEMLERISPKNDTEQAKTANKEQTKVKTDTPSKKLPTQELIKPAYTRFGFKLNMDFNPFSVPPKTDKPKELPKTIQPITLPSLTGATLGKKENSFSRRDVAKQAVMREKSFVGKRTMNRKENRTIIKGVRTNRRFELQMKFRNIDN